MRTGLLVAMLAATSCSVFAKDNPTYCDTNVQCVPMTCDTQQHRCIDPATALELTAVVPAIGPTAGGIPVLIRGKHFQPGMTVGIDGVSAEVTSISVTGDSAIINLPKGKRFCVPVPVRVKNPDGQIVISSTLFKYKVSPANFVAQQSVSLPPNFVDLAAVPSASEVSDFLLVSPTSDTVEQYINDGLGTLTTQGNGGRMTGYTHIFAARLPTSTSDFGVLTMGGTGITAWTVTDRIFVEKPFFKPQNSAAFLASGDFNGDGVTDMVLVDAMMKVLSFVNGDTTKPSGFGGDTIIPDTFVMPVFGALAAADFDGDGLTDFAVALTGTKKVAIYFGGPTPFIDRLQIVLPNNASLLAAADVNGDGRPDLLATIGNSVTVLLNQQGRTFGSAVSSLIDNTPAVFQTADVDCDELPDLVYASVGSSGQDLVIVPNSGVSPFYSGAPTHVPLPGPVLQIAPTKVNRDDLIDLAVLYKDSLSTTNKLGLLINTPQ